MVGQICSWCAVASFGIFTLLLCVFIYMLWSRCVEQNLCVFSVTTIRDHHKLPGLNNKNALSYSFVIQNCEIRCTKIKMSAGLFFFFLDQGKNEFPSFFQLLEATHSLIYSPFPESLKNFYHCISFSDYSQESFSILRTHLIRLDSSKIIQMVSPSQDLQRYSYLQSLLRYEVPDFQD